MKLGESEPRGGSILRDIVGTICTMEETLDLILWLESVYFLKF